MDTRERVHGGRLPFDTGGARRYDQKQRIDEMWGPPLRRRNSGEERNMNLLMWLFNLPGMLLSMILSPLNLLLAAIYGLLWPRE